MDETTSILSKTAAQLPARFLEEAQHLLKSNKYDPNTDAVCTLIRVALERVAQLYDRGDSRTYRNLTKF